MAHTKAAGAAKRTVNVAGKRLGLKKFGGEFVKAGNIIMRQRGTQFHPGNNVMLGRDHTIFATAPGFVSFRHMTGLKRSKKFIDVVPAVENIHTKAKNAANTTALKSASTTRTSARKVVRADAKTAKKASDAKEAKKAAK